MAIGTREQPPRPLIVTADPGLLDTLLRLTSTAGIIPVVAADPTSARFDWGAAPLVVLDVAQAEECLRAGLAPRPGLVLVATTAPDDVLWRLARAFRAEYVAELPLAEPWLLDRFEDVGSPTRVAKVVGVIGGRGGAGASVFAAGFAVTAARAGQRVLLVDADPLGGGVDLILGWEDLGGSRWPELAAENPGLHATLPRAGRLTVLSQGRDKQVEITAESMDATLLSGQRESDLIVVDLPRALDGAALRALRYTDRMFLITPAELRACAAAARVVASAAPHCAPIELIVRGPSPGKLRPRDMARALHLPLAGNLPPEPGLTAALERGEAPARGGEGPLAELSLRLLTELRPVST